MNKMEKVVDEMAAYVCDKVCRYRVDREMREILFRGKRIYDGRWVDGCYMTDEQNQATA